MIDFVCSLYRTAVTASHTVGDVFDCLRSLPDAWLARKGRWSPGAQRFGVFSAPRFLTIQ